MIKGLVKIDDTLVICVDEIGYFFENVDPTKDDYRCEITFKNNSKVWTTATVNEVWVAINYTAEQKRSSSVEVESDL